MSSKDSTIEISAERPYHKIDQKLVIFFVLLALATRIFFWAYTGRVWEDFLITLNPAQNLWDGHGLTHHVPEPRVYSFTSTLSILILVAGEAIHQAIDFNRVLSLFAAVVTIVYAARVMAYLGVHWIGQIACLCYLATDHLQVFFGMAGMETQIATAIALCTVFYAITGGLTLFGIFAGLALLARPDMLLLDGICFLYVLFRHGRRTLRPLAICAALVAPWILFATLYYGSPIPETITVKSYMAGKPELADMLAYAGDIWRQFAPFWEFWFVRAAPVPLIVPMVVVALTLACAILGLATWRQHRLSLLMIGAIAFVFAAYLIKNTVNPYFMWYAPPFTALYFIVVAAGLSSIRARSMVIASCCSAVIMAGYAVPAVFAFPLDRVMQRDVDVAVRTEVGKTLNRMMGPNDSVFLEPLGYIGIEIKDRMIYDYPGLGSKRAFAAVKDHGWSAIEVLNPDFIVFRPEDFDTARSTMPDLLPKYDEVAHIVGGTGTLISFHGLSYGVADNEFFILRRKALPH